MVKKTKYYILAKIFFNDGIFRWQELEAFDDIAYNTYDEAFDVAFNYFNDEHLFYITEKKEG